MQRHAFRSLLVTLLFLPLSLFVNAQLSYSFLYVNTNSYSANSGGTTIINGNTNDGISAVQNIGFTFTYNCNTYTQFMVSSNGWMVLGAGMTGSLPGNNLNTLGQGPILAPLWDDMKIESGANVNMKLSGSSPNRIMTIEWNNVLWNASASNPALSYQVKLYEGTNVIEFVYYREAGSSTVVNASGSVGITSGTSATDIYSVDIGTTTASYGYDQPGQNARPAGGRTFRWTPTTMSYTSTTSTQASTASVTKCNPNDQVILGVEVVTSGACSPYSVTNFQVNMTGSTAIADVSKIHIYYTGLSSGFAPVNEFVSGGSSPAAGNFNIAGSQVLKGGTNYFWIAYDIAAGATIGDLLDAQCLSVTISGGIGVKTPSTTNPSGTRTIANCTAAPGGVDGASFWVRGGAGTSTTTDGGTISSWNDQSGNGRNATQSTNSNKPLYANNSTDNMNFNPVVTFDAASQSATNGDYMDITANGVLSPGNNPYTVYSVIRPGAGNTSTPGKYLFTGQPGSNNFNSFDVRSGGTYNDSWNLNDLLVGGLWTSGYPSLATFNYNTSQREMFVSGNSVGTRAGNDRISPNTNNALGCQRSNNPLIEFYDGDIAEIVTYANYSHTTAQRYQVETYLGIKYGMTLPHNYVASNGTTIWNVATNPSYNSNIIGIGRDDNGALSQKQSKSTAFVQDMLTVYIGAAKTTDQATNTGTFASDRSFFMVGNNNASYSTYPYGSTPEAPAGICCRIQREWMVQKTNFTNTDLKLEFDFNVVTPGYSPLNTADLRLLVDADGNFTNATILNSPAITISVSGSKVTVTVPASNFGAVSYFTLGSVSTAALLPVNITGFTGMCKNEAVQLKWTKESGPDNSFTVERSIDGNNFTAMGTLQSDALTPQTYTWSDKDPLPGVGYYRLKMVGADGATAYSGIVSANGCSHNSLQLASDAVSGQSTLLMQLPQNAVVDISFCDMLGRRYDVSNLTGHRSLQQGYYRLPVDDSHLPRGVYVLTVSVNGSSSVFRVVKH